VTIIVTLCSTWIIPTLAFKQTTIFTLALPKEKHMSCLVDIAKYRLSANQYSVSMAEKRGKGN